MMYNKEQMIKPEQDSKVENHTYCCRWIEKNKKHKICINTQQLNTMEENYSSNKNYNGSGSQELGSLTGQPY